MWQDWLCPASLGLLLVDTLAQDACVMLCVHVAITAKDCFVARSGVESEPAGYWCFYFGLARKIQVVVMHFQGLTSGLRTPAKYSYSLMPCFLVLRVHYGPAASPYHGLKQGLHGQL